MDKKNLTGGTYNREGLGQTLFDYWFLNNICESFWATRRCN